MIGRSPECDVRLGDPSVSRRHAELRHGDAGWSVGDLGSLNGVLVNGRRVARSTVEPGDRLSLGDATLMLQLRD